MYYFIVNPGSRSGNGRHVWKEVEEILETEDVEYRVFFTSSRCHATRLAREITARDERITLAAVGGDGTVSEVLSGIQDFSKVTFAYIPTGSSNDFARSLGLPSDTAAAVQNLLHPSYFRRIDLGKARLGEQALYFAVSCGCGYDAAICHAAFYSSVKKLLNRLRLGKLTYIATGIRQLLLSGQRPCRHAGWAADAAPAPGGLRGRHELPLRGGRRAFLPPGPSRRRPARRLHRGRLQVSHHPSVFAVSCGNPRDPARRASASRPKRGAYKPQEASPAHGRRTLFSERESAS